jgi:hypothetical protein
MPLSLLATPALAKWVGGGVLLVVLAGALGWFYHDWRVSALEAELNEALRTAGQWQQLAVGSQAQIKAIRDERAARDAAVEQLASQLRAISSRHEQLRSRIRDSPAHDDGPVAPVLRDALEALP